MVGGPRSRKVGISLKGGVPDMRYFVANSSFVALLSRLSDILQGKPSCFRRDFNKSYHAFGEICKNNVFFAKNIQVNHFRFFFTVDDLNMVQLTQKMQKKINKKLKKKR